MPRFVLLVAVQAGRVFGPGRSGRLTVLGRFDDDRQTISDMTVQQPGKFLATTDDQRLKYFPVFLQSLRPALRSKVRDVAGAIHA